MKLARKEGKIMKTAKLGIILSIFALACFLFACAETGPTVKPAAQAGKKTTIRIGSPFKPGSILVDAAEKFKELVEKGSGGRIQVQIDAGTKSEEVINKANRSGELEMQSNGTMFLQDYAPPYYFFTGPYVMKNFEHYMRVWDGKLGQAARAQLEKNDLKYLGTIYRGLRQMTTKKPVYTPADVYGLKLRLPNVPTWMAVWKAMGTDPVGVPLPELYNSLKTGKAEASEGDLPQIQSFKLYQVQNYLIITNHLVQTGGILINKPFFDKLSKADQNLIVKAGKEAEEWANNKIKTGEADILVNLQRMGMQVVIPDADSFREMAKPAVDELFKTQWSVTTWAEVLAQ
jgi:tripartite ATP-independent transporter DctP family solute receptor